MLGAQRQRLTGAMDGCLREPRDRARAATRALAEVATRRVGERSATLAALAGRLHALSPLATLERGYAAARDAEGRTRSSVGDFAEGDAFTLRLRDGEVDATTREVRPSAEEKR